MNRASPEPAKRATDKLIASALGPCACCGTTQWPRRALAPGFGLPLDLVGEVLCIACSHSSLSEAEVVDRMRGSIRWRQ